MGILQDRLGKLPAKQFTKHTYNVCVCVFLQRNSLDCSIPAFLLINLMLFGHFSWSCWTSGDSTCEVGMVYHLSEAHKTFRATKSSMFGQTTKGDPY